MKKVSLGGKVREGKVSRKGETFVGQCLGNRKKKMVTGILFLVTRAKKVTSGGGQAVRNRRGGDSTLGRESNQ